MNERLPREERSARMREERESAILAAAMMLAETRGYRLMSRDAIAQEAGCARGLISRYFGSMEELRDAVMVEAVRLRNIPIVRQGLADGNIRARNAPFDLREAAIRSTT